MRQTSAGRSGTRAALVVAAVGLLAATIGVTAARNDGTDSPPSESSVDTSGSSSTSTSEPDVAISDLTGTARDLAELLAQGRTGTYHAVYHGTASSGEGGTLTLETWAKAGRFRQDTVVDVGGEPFHRANFVLPDTGAACTRLGDAPWSCGPAAPSDEQGADLLSGNTLDQLRQAAVGESPGEVEGHRARCFTITYDAQTTELCASEDGVPLRIRSQASELLIELLEDDVPDDVFEFPAPVS